MAILSSLTLGCAVVCLFGLWGLTGGDLWMWLTVGRWTWQHGGPPLIDHFSFTTPGEPFFAHSWLSALTFYLIEQSVGWLGFRALRLTLISLALVCAVHTARLMGAQWPAIILLAPVVLGMMWARLEFRPQLFTTLLLAWQLWLVISVHTGDRSWRWLWVLPPIYALWISLHGGWVMGMAMLGAVGIALMAMDLRRRWLANLDNVKVRGRRKQKQVATAPIPELTIPSHLPLQHLALVLVGCGLALLINPYGWRLIVFPFQMQADWIRAIGREWQSPFGNAGWRDVGGGILLYVEPLFWLYVVAVGAVLLARLRQWRTADLVPVAVMGLWLMMSLRHLRAVSDMVLLTAPFIAAALPRWRRWPVVVGSVLTLGIVAWSLPDSVAALGSWRQPSEHRRICLATAFSRLRLAGRVFSHEHNSWLLYKFHPEVRVDAIWDFVTGPRRLAERQVAQRDGATLHLFLERHHVDVAVLTTSTRKDGSRDIPGLVARGWVVIHADHNVNILVPHRPDTARLIEQEGYRWLYQVEQWPATSAQALALLEESERALRHCPQTSYAWVYKAHALRFLGFHDEAAAADRTAKSLLDAMPVR